MSRSYSSYDSKEDVRSLPKKPKTQWFIDSKKQEKEKFSIVLIDEEPWMRNKFFHYLSIWNSSEDPNIINLNLRSPTSNYDLKKFEALIARCKIYVTQAEILTHSEEVTAFQTVYHYQILLNSKDQKQVTFLAYLIDCVFNLGEEYLKLINNLIYHIPEPIKEIDEAQLTFNNVSNLPAEILQRFIQRKLDEKLTLDKLSDDTNRITSKLILLNLMKDWDITVLERVENCYLRGCETQIVLDELFASKYGNYLAGKIKEQGIYCEFIHYSDRPLLMFSKNIKQLENLLDIKFVEKIQKLQTSILEKEKVDKQKLSLITKSKEEKDCSESVTQQPVGSKPMGLFKAAAPVADSKDEKIPLKAGPG